MAFDSLGVVKPPRSRLTSLVRTWAELDTWLLPAIIPWSAAACTSELTGPSATIASVSTPPTPRHTMVTRRRTT